MKSFPKKYSPKDLHNRSYKYKENTNNKWDTIFSTSVLSNSKKLNYRDFFLVYLNDFFDSIQSLKGDRDNNYQQLFVVCWNQIHNICCNFEFFSKKNQTLLQIWRKKLERRMISTSRKVFNANNKILENYLDSSHKIYLPDSDLYLYVLKQFKKLWDKWKIKNETKIWYWSFNLQTSIPLEKITRREEKKPYYVVKYFIWAKADALLVSVDGDIDLCCGDVALLVHPKDKRYNKYIWKNVIIPLCNRQIPIIWDENVNIAVNNWIKRVCPCSDQESITLAEKFWLPTDIYVFDKEWLYTDYIHEKAFIGQKRNKYYDNIVWFMEDIGNIATKWENIAKVPYIEQINERLVPYKMNQLIIDFSEEKEKIIDKIIENKLEFSFLSDFDLDEDDLFFDDSEELLEWDEIEKDEESLKLKQTLTDKIDWYLPDSLVCNSQTPFWLRVPLIKNSEWNFEFFDIEKICLDWNDNYLQVCFDFVLLSLVRSWIIWMYLDKESRLCEYDKMYVNFLDNEKKIEYFVQYLSDITWKKEEYDRFLKIIENLSNETDATIGDLYNLIDNSSFLRHEWSWLILGIDWLVDDIIDSEIVQLCIFSYLKSKWIKFNNQEIFSSNDRWKIFKGLLVQEALDGDAIFSKFLEENYDEKSEYLWNKELTKLQLEQSQRDLFSLYGENPIRLCLLVNKTFDQREILLNNIFLKQIRNATRLCIQKNFLPENIEEILGCEPDISDDFDVSVLDKLDGLYCDRKNIDTYEKYIKFFESFKASIQNIFFSRYLEIQKVSPTKNVQFVCSYFFNFLLNILYPLVPEFVDALQYISDRKFLNPVKPVKLDKNMNYNMNLLYNTFIKIKEMKIEYNIKQHEYCNIFIKSTPTIWDMFAENEQIFKNYFHISDISYIRLHESNPLWYEIFSDEVITLWIQNDKSKKVNEKDSIENIEREIRNLDDKLNLLRQRIQYLEWEQRKKAEEEYAKTKDEIENLTIKHSLLSSK